MRVYSTFKSELTFEHFAPATKDERFWFMPSQEGSGQLILQGSGVSQIGRLVYDPSQGCNASCYATLNLSSKGP